MHHVKPATQQEDQTSRTHITSSYCNPHKRRRRHATANTISLLTCLSTLISPVTAVHHLDQPPVQLANRQNSDVSLIVTSNCAETIYPAILSQSGTGPLKAGFRLKPGESLPQTVSADWRGRVWGRTNCSFTDDGTVPISGQGGAVCSSGDCGAFVECQGAGNPPATLAEFTLASSSNQAFYDISLVDGYNLPMGIVFQPGNGSSLSDIPPNLTNAVCIGTSSYLTDPSAASDATLGSNSSYPIPLDTAVTTQNVLKWCPFPLQLNPPKKPGDGVYPYPDDNIARPVFNPCYSACSKWNDDKYCCSGSYNTPDKCKPSYYSVQAKKVCPDAYSYAYDDQTSTFTLPQGGGFEIVFCPSGRSSNILKTFGNQIRELARTGLVTPEMESLARNTTYIAEKSEGSMIKSQASAAALVVFFIWVCFW